MPPRGALLGLHRRGDAGRHRRRLPRRRRDPALRRPRARPHLHRPAAPRPRPRRDAVPRRRHHARRIAQPRARGRGHHPPRALLEPHLRRREASSAACRARSAVVGFSAEDVYAHRRAAAPAEGRRGGGHGRALARARATPRSRSTRPARSTTSSPPTRSAWGSTSTSTMSPSPASRKFDGREHAPPDARPSSARSPAAPGATSRTAPSAPPASVARSTPSWSRRSRTTASAPLARLHWRNSELDFATPADLAGAASTAPPDPGLQRAREADDLAAWRSWPAAR